jgi:hypothetical protein
MEENKASNPRPKVKIGLRWEVAFALVFLLTISGLIALAYGFLAGQATMLGVGLLSLTLAGGTGLLLINSRFPRKK